MSPCAQQAGVDSARHGDTRAERARALPRNRRPGRPTRHTPPPSHTHTHCVCVAYTHSLFLTLPRTILGRLHRLLRCLGTAILRKQGQTGCALRARVRGGVMWRAFDGGVGARARSGPTHAPHPSPCPPASRRPAAWAARLGPEWRGRPRAQPWRRARVEGRSVVARGWPRREQTSEARQRRHDRPTAPSTHPCSGVSACLSSDMGAVRPVCATS
jgi:hypothetical protein